MSEATIELVHRNCLKNWFLTASDLPQHFCLHFRLALTQWSLIGTIALVQLGHLAKSLASEILQVGKFSLACLFFLLGELPIRIVAAAGGTLTTALEWGIVRPLELGFSLIAEAMEAVKQQFFCKM